MDNLKIILLYSGGLDSIGALWKLLTEGNDDIYVQHLDIDCEWKHWEAEKAATDKSLEYMKKHCRDFTILPNVYFSSEGSPIYNPLCIFFGSLSLLENNAVRLYTANINGDNVPRITRWWDKMGYPIFLSLTDGHDVKSERPFMNVFKDHWHEILPKELVNMAMSCRHPLKIDDGTWEQCGTCNSCLELVESSDGIFPPDRKPEMLPTPLMYPHFTNRKKTIVLISKCNNGMEELERLLDTSNDFLCVQYIDVQNLNVPDSYKDHVNERLENLENEYMIKRLKDVVVKSPFDPSADPLTVMFSFCSAFRRYSNHFDRMISGEFINADYDKLRIIYDTMLDGAYRGVEWKIT